MYTIVTAFFNIGRDKWKFYARPLVKYLENAQRIMSLDDQMVIYIEPRYVDFVRELRKKYPEKTKIIPATVEDLAYYKYKNEIQNIMEDPRFKAGLADPVCPEVSEPLYDVIMWSKIPLVVRTIEENPFQSSHFVWLDFGVHTHMLQEEMLHKKLLENVPDKIKMLCRSYPMPADLEIEKFYKSHTNRLAGTMITGSADNFRLLNRYLEAEVEECLKKRVVDSDQALFTVIFLKHPELFQLHYGNWAQLISNYTQVRQNLSYVMHLAFTCRDLGNKQAYEEILGTVGKYSLELWNLYPKNLRMQQFL